MPHINHLPCYDYVNNICWRVTDMKLTTESSASSPSHIKYSPHHPALRDPQSVLFSWHKTPNFTPTQNDRNNVSFTDEYMQHSELKGSKYCLHLSCSFFQDHGPSHILSGDSCTSQAMLHKILTALDFTIKECSKSILLSPTVSWIQITREATNSEYLLNVNNTQQKHMNLIRVHHYLICHWLLKLFLCYISDMWHLKL